MSTPPAPDLDELPSPPERVEEVTINGGLWTAKPGLTAQIVRRRTTHLQTGRLVDFAIVLLLGDEGTGEWRELLKIDTAHRQVHVHHAASTSGVPDTAEVPVDCRENIDRAFQWVREYVWAYYSREVA